DGAAQGGVEAGELLLADRAGRIDAGTGLVDDDVGQLRQGIRERLGRRRWRGWRLGRGRGGGGVGEGRRWLGLGRRLGKRLGRARFRWRRDNRFRGSGSRDRLGHGEWCCLDGGGGRGWWRRSGRNLAAAAGIEFGDQFGDDFLRLAAGGAVADGDDV